MARKSGKRIKLTPTNIVLPPEIWVMIFSKLERKYLAPLRYVSHGWQNMILSVHLQTLPRLNGVFYFWHVENIKRQILTDIINLCKHHHGRYGDYAERIRRARAIKCLFDKSGSFFLLDHFPFTVVSIERSNRRKTKGRPVYKLQCTASFETLIQLCRCLSKKYDRGTPYTALPQLSGGRFIVRKNRTDCLCLHDSKDIRDACKEWENIHYDSKPFGGGAYEHIGIQLQTALDELKIFLQNHDVM